MAPRSWRYIPKIRERGTHGVDLVGETMLSENFRGSQ